MKQPITWSVFTKPWKTIALEQLADLVRGMGFDAVEYPLRQGYQIQPADGAKGLRRLTDIMGSRGLAVASIAGGIDVRDAWGNNCVTGVNEQLFSACAEAGIRIVRICQGLDPTLGFRQNIEQIQRTYDGILPLCQKYNVTLGVQMHCGMNISSAAETLLLLQKYDRRYIAAVWDSGHNGLAGTEPEIALDTVWPHLCMINFKAAFYQRTTGPEADEANWHEYWTTGRNACGSWPRAARWLKQHNYRGVICLPAEYSDQANVENYTRQDITYIKSLFSAGD